MKIVISCVNSEKDQVTKNREYCVYKISSDNLYHIFNDECKPIIPLYANFKSIPYCRIKKSVISIFGEKKYQNLVNDTTTEIRKKYPKMLDDELRTKVGQMVSDEIIESYCYIKHIPFNFRKVK